MGCSGQGVFLGSAGDELLKGSKTTLAQSGLHLSPDLTQHKVLPQVQQEMPKIQTEQGAEAGSCEIPAVPRQELPLQESAPAGALHTQLCPAEHMVQLRQCPGSSVPAPGVSQALLPFLQESSSPSLLLCCSLPREVLLKTYKGFSAQLPNQCPSQHISSPLNIHEAGAAA